jgi:hypothetical protein
MGYARAARIVIGCTPARYPHRMTIAEAEELLAGLRLVPATAGSIADMRALRDRCLAVDVAATVGCPPGAGKG